jgi:hypothetical protein
MDRTWLHLAAGRGHLAMVEALVQLGLDVNEPCGGNPETPLHSAAWDGRVETAKWLLDHGAKVDAVDNYGRTPLISAATDGSVETVRLLLDSGADVHASYGQPPVDAVATALSRGHTEVADLLRGRGAAKAPAVVRAPDSSLPGQIVAHVEKHLGPVQAQALVEIVPAGIPISIHVASLRADPQSLTLFTTGMSDLAMKVPDGRDCSPYAELLIDLPRSWPLSHEALKDANNYWPVEWLRRLAQYAHGQGVCLADGDIVSNEEPPRPFASGTRQSCMLVLDDFSLESMRSRDGRVVAFYRLVPLYREERDLYEARGVVPLLELFQKHRIGRNVDMKRPNVAAVPA